MKRFLCLFLCVLTVCLGVVYIGGIGLKAKNTLKDYQSMHPFSDREMVFKTVEKPWFSQGLIFRHPIFPSLPLVFQADRLILRFSPETIQINLRGIVADLAQTLMKRDGENLPRAFNKLKTSSDFILYPIEGLVLLNQDIFRGDMDIFLTRTDHGAQLKIVVRTPNRGPVEIRTILSPLPKQDLWDFVHTPFQTVNFISHNTELNRALAGYLAAVQADIPDGLKQAVTLQKPYSNLIMLPHPVSLSDILDSKGEHSWAKTP